MFYNFANTKRDRRDFREAILLYKEAIRLHPKYAKAFDNLGAIYDDGTSDGMEQAEEMYQKAINANPHHPSAYCNLANLMASQERLGEAVQILLQVRNYDSPYYTALMRLAQIMHRRGFEKDAELLYQHILLLFKEKMVLSAEPYNHYGVFLTDVKRYDDAIKVFEQAMEIEPRNPDHMVNLAWVKETLGALGQAEKLYNRAIELGESSVALMRFAALKMKTGKVSEADRLYSAAYQLDPKNPQLAIERSVVLESIDKHQALEVLTNARETLDPDCKFPDLHINLGKLIGIATTNSHYIRAAAVLDHCERHLDVNEIEASKASEVKYYLALFHDNIAKKYRGVPAENSEEESLFDQSIRKSKKLLNEAINLKPGDTEYRLLLGQIHLRMGELDIGQNWLNTVLKLKSDHDAALILTEKVKKKKESLKSQMS